MIFDIHAHYGQWLSTSIPDTPERFSALLDRFRIDNVIVSSGRAIQYDICSGNAEVADLVTRDKRIYGAVVVNPNQLDESLDDMERHSSNKRFIAVKHHPDYSGTAVDSPLMEPVLDYTAELGLPLFVHTWGESQINSACAVAKKYPELTLFLFHMGGDAWRLAVERAVEYPNVNLEFISSIPDPERIRVAVETLGPERVFFGTDMTLISPAVAIGLMKGARLSEADAQRVFSLNAKEFFHID